MGFGVVESSAAPTILSRCGEVRVLEMWAAGFAIACGATMPSVRGRAFRGRGSGQDLVVPGLEVDGRDFLRLGLLGRSMSNALA